jgi:hypothetical protein
VFPERSCVARWQISFPQPSATQRLDSVVVILGDAVIRFKPFDHPDGGLGVRFLRGAMPWEEALLFVCAMPRRQRPEVVQSCS